MNIFMTGGTGFVGSFLSKELALAGHDVSILEQEDPIFLKPSCPVKSTQIALCTRGQYMRPGSLINLQHTLCNSDIYASCTIYLCFDSCRAH